MELLSQGKPFKSSRKFQLFLGETKATIEKLLSRTKTDLKKSMSLSITVKLVANFKIQRGLQTHIVRSVENPCCREEGAVQELVFTPFWMVLVRFSNYLTKQIFFLSPSLTAGNSKETPFVFWLDKSGWPDRLQKTVLKTFMPDPRNLFFTLIKERARSDL